MSITIKQAEMNSSLWRSAWAVREEVFICEQNVPPDIERDEYDDTAIHLVALDGEKPLGTLRIVTLDSGVAKIGRVAVLKGLRRKGIGRDLMFAAMDRARARGIKHLVLTAQVPVIPFYERLGFLAEGPVFDEAGIPHRKMTLTFPTGKEPFQIDADFPGGNIIVDTIRDNTAYLRQDIRTTTEWWFYWHFRIRNAAGRTIRFNFTNRDAFSARGPCKRDPSGTWHWLGREVLQDRGFSHTFSDTENETFLSVGFPYVETDLRAFLMAHPAIKAETLTNTKAGRPVELLTLRSKHSRFVLPLTARHHACEAMASFALEGFLDFWLTDASGSGRFLRENVDLIAVPFIDKDGVETGDQGKQRAPHDHNRDYIPQPLYAVTRALTSRLLSLAPRVKLGFDLHCPWIRGGRHEVLQLVHLEEPWATPIRAFSALLERTQQGELKYHSSGDIPHGVDWNVGQYPSYSRWASKTLPGIDFLVSVETPYAVADGQTVTPAAAHAFGADLARASAYYLKDSHRV